MESDAVLIEGTCVVNESMLTGESIPVTKVGNPFLFLELIPMNWPTLKLYCRSTSQTKVFPSNTIYSGNLSYFVARKSCRGKPVRGNFAKQLSSGQVISLCCKIRNVLNIDSCLVGFMTTKGELVRSILFPPPLDFQFHRDFLKSIYVFLTIGIIGMIYSIWMWWSKGVSQLPFQICAFQAPSIIQLLSVLFRAPCRRFCSIAWTSWPSSCLQSFQPHSLPTTPLRRKGLKRKGFFVFILNIFHSAVALTYVPLIRYICRFIHSVQKLVSFLFMQHYYLVVPRSIGFSDVTLRILTTSLSEWSRDKYFFFCSVHVQDINFSIIILSIRRVPWQKATSISLESARLELANSKKWSRTLWTFL